MKRNASLPKIEKIHDPLVGLKADVDFVKSNKQDFEFALKKLSSVNKIRSSLKTIKLDSSYNATYKRGDLPEFYIENKLKMQKEKEEELKKKEEERIYNENK